MNRLLKTIGIASLLLAGSAPLSAKTFDLSTATIADIIDATDAGALSSEKLVQLYLDRIEAYDKQGPKINSIFYLNEEALAEAKALDKERLNTGRRSPLHGIPVMVKDLIDVKGFPTTAGFKPFGYPMPERDAEVIRKLKEAGAIVLAKVATVNWYGNGGFDSEQHPTGWTLNPYNIEHSPGSSSNGTGASIAAWFATVGLGTDTGGSVQIPSSYSSLVGMVGTQGLVSRSGIVPRGPTQDRAGPMTRSVYDTAALFSVIAGWDVEDLTTADGIGYFPESDWAELLGTPSLEGKRIGVLREMIQDPSDPEVIERFEAAVQDLKDGGALVVDPILTGTNLREFSGSPITGTTHPYELVPASNAYLRRLGPDRPFETIQDMFEAAGMDIAHPRYVTAMSLPSPETIEDYQGRHKLRLALRELIEETIDKWQLDALVLPYRTLPPPAISTGRTSGDGDRNTLTSVTGLPGIIMPGGYTSENLPVGIQFVGKRFSDLDLLRVAYGYEAASQNRKPAESVPALPGEVFEY
ncbi:amidase [Pelagicoccus sp. SDUM812003]|uniref:amidase n=1 Tax=Pelagicoccus sp. SDUM812003 TaxID=3041267 RepID=UPI00280E6934|nr:amidase [Pelagicoccus sp. SDUM812003]MDQ8204680.1 amidase [Pelagicoccus sp. SDUM812003]